MLIISIQVLVPCMDGLHVEGSASEVLMASLTEEHEEDHEGHEDHCSPFCTCACCQTNSVPSAKHFFETVPLQPIVVAPRIGFLLPTYTNRIWQPPQA